MRSSSVRVAVVGAGIGGLTVAAALSRAGLRCQVFEQAGAFGEVGAGIQLAPNAVRILHDLGLADHLRSVAVRPAAIEMRRWDDGRLLRRTDLGQCEELFGAPYYTVHRADLHRGLTALLPDGLVHLGRQCSGVSELPGGARLRFADGSSEPADVVIGADGIHSVVRGLLARDQPRFSGQTIYRGLVPAERVVPLLAEPRVVLWLGPHRHCVSYPVSGGRALSFGATAPARHRQAESWSTPGRVEALAAGYAGWNAETARLLSAPDAVGQWALHDRDPIGRWSTARVTLLGDAAHPMLPFLAQGANQAIEDAMVLTVLLAAAGSDAIAQALSHYERLRRARTEKVHRISRANTALLHLPDGAEQRRRDRMLRRTADLRGQAWLYGYRAEREARIPRSRDAGGFRRRTGSSAAGGPPQVRAPAGSDGKEDNRRG